jgi:hypothetical protein
MREQGVDCRDTVNNKVTTLEKSYSAAPSLLELVLHLDATTSWAYPVDLLFSWYGVMSRRPPDAKKLRVSCFAKRQCCVLYCTLFSKELTTLLLVFGFRGTAVSLYLCNLLPQFKPEVFAVCHGSGCTDCQ